MNKALQYIQLDYLRLFRLCKNIELVKKKRKMPTETEDLNQKSSSKRLLSLVIKSLFDSNYAVRNDSSYYYITLPKELNSILNSLINKPRNYFLNAGAEGEKALAMLGEIKQMLLGHVIPALPYEIKVSPISLDSNSRFKVVSRTNPKTSKPREDFYRCALACIEFKKKWDVNIPYLTKFYSEEEGRQAERAAEALKLKQERRRAERLRLEQERNGISAAQDKKSQEIGKETKEVKEKTESVKNLEDRIEKEKQEKINNAQNLFNQSLESFKRTDNG